MGRVTCGGVIAVIRNLFGTPDGCEPLPNVCNLILQVYQKQVIRDLHNDPDPVRYLYSIVKFGSPDVHRRPMVVRKCAYLPYGFSKRIETVERAHQDFSLSGFAGHLQELQP